MNRVQILDCTLRDGGYCNQWKFGEKNKKIIVNGLCIVFSSSAALHPPVRRESEK